MKELMRKFRRGELTSVKQITVGEIAINLVHQEGRARFFQDENRRMLVNADTDERVVEILQGELQYLRDLETGRLEDPLAEVKDEVRNNLSFRH